jgi:delta24-sterol reductase
VFPCVQLTTVGPLKELYQKQHVVQDMLVPLSRTGEALRVFDDAFGVYPLWLCPFKIPQSNRERRSFVQPLEDGEELFVDVGAYVRRALLAGHEHASAHNCKCRVCLMPRTSKHVPAFARSRTTFAPSKGENWCIALLCRLPGLTSFSASFQMLYADSEQTREEFRQMFDHTL